MGRLDAVEDAAKLGRGVGRGADDLAALGKAANAGSDAAQAARDAAAANKGLANSLKGDFKLGDDILGDARAAGKDLKTETKGAGELASDAKNLKAGEQTAEEAKKVQATVKDTDSYLAQAKKACTSDKKMCAAGVLGTAAAIYAADKYLTVKGYKGQITKIENDTDGGIMGYGGTPVAKVTYAKPIDILMTDTIDFSETDCDPKLDGTKSPYKIAGPTEVWIKLDAALTAPGTKGAFKITTGVLPRLGQAVGEGAGAAGAAAGQAAGAAAGGLSGAMGGLLRGFTSGAGLWLAIACAVLIFGFIIFKFIM
jgi:hypothetical protein